jgi:3-deoxy-D-manno-octulosonic-acid transferase
MYLPLDFPSSARDFISMLKPSMAIFIKYEFWHYYLKNLKEQHIPAILVSGIFRPSQPFFHWWGNFHRGMLRCFTLLFVQDRDSANLLSKIGLTEEVVISGDTRFDRVIEIATDSNMVSLPEGFSGNQCLVAGSTWKEDELLLAAWHNKNPEWQMIIVPHEIHPSRIEEIKTIFPGCILFSELNNESIADSINVIIVDKIGLLSKLYKAGSICYVGGGFSKNGHHNILEAAVYGKAVVTGPNFKKFLESVELKEIGGSFTVNNAEELNKLTSTEESIKLAGKKSREYVMDKVGATEKIVSFIQEKRLLTKA